MPLLERAESDRDGNGFGHCRRCAKSKKLSKQGYCGYCRKKLDVAEPPPPGLRRYRAACTHLPTGIMVLRCFVVDAESKAAAKVLARHRVLATGGGEYRLEGVCRVTGGKRRAPIGILGGGY